ncbi:MAG: HAD family hydrolase [Burkholderiales bacterium]
MSTPHETVYLFDVDNTLLDNDRVVADLRAHLIDAFGTTSAERYWAGFEALRSELGYADYLGALQRCRVDAANDPKLLAMSAFLLDYPFASRLYAGALGALAHVRRRGPTVILSDGDVVFQPRKIERARIWSAVEGRVLIYIHKEQTLDDMQRRHPARHYVMVDDKLRILSAMKAQMGARLTTVFVRQGHYAFDLAAIKDFPPADLTIERIGDLASMELP